MDLNKVFSYLTALSENNNRDWYQEHKKDHKIAMEIFEDVIAKLCLDIGSFENTPIEIEPKKLTFRLARDTRFSADKRPYNAAFWAHISPYGKDIIPIGYYICIEPGNKSCVICGLHTGALKDATSLIRDFIVEHGNEFQEILSEEVFAKRYRLMGEALKNVPRGYDNTLPQAEYLKNKSWYVEEYFTDDEVKDTELYFKNILEICKITQPFKKYLNQALKEFKMPVMK